MIKLINYGYAYYYYRDCAGIVLNISLIICRFGFGTKESFLIVIIGYTNVNCQGNETHLFQCSLSTEASGCQESESVGIQCSKYYNIKNLIHHFPTCYAYSVKSL